MTSSQVYRTIAFLLLTMMANSLWAKRPPEEVRVVEYGGVRYSVIHWAVDSGSEQNGGYVRLAISRTIESSGVQYNYTLSTDSLRSLQPIGA